MPKLIVLTEGIEPSSFELKEEVSSVGRVEENAFTIPHQSISGQHCELILQGEEVYIKDLGSTNGSFINGNKVAESPLKPGQVLGLGEVELKLEGGADSDKKVQTLDKVSEQGVKLGDLEGAVKAADAKGFKKKSDEAGRLFTIITLAVILLFIAVIIFGVLLTERPPS